MEAKIMEVVEVAEPVTLEGQLARTGVDTVGEARGLAIKDDIGYNWASEFLRAVKQRAKQVAEYWAIPKAQAKAAHQAIVNKEKAMLSPLTEAEEIVKKQMAAYRQHVEAEQRQLESEAKERQKQEADRLLMDAVQAERIGDGQGAAIALTMAEMVEDMPVAASMASTPKAAGTSVRKVWKARITNPALVPISHGGVEIRPIDEKALQGIARMSRGTAQIPGVEFYEEAVIVARA